MVLEAVCSRLDFLGNNFKLYYLNKKSVISALSAKITDFVLWWLECEFDLIGKSFYYFLEEPSPLFVVLEPVK